MKSILAIERDKQFRSWTKKLSEGKFKIRFSSSTGEGLQSAVKHPTNLILFDIDKQEISLEQFVKDMKSLHLTIPVVVVSSRRNLDASPEIKTPGVVGSIQKPFSQNDFLKRIHKVFQEQDHILQQELTKGRESTHLHESEIMIGFRKEATIYKVSKHGMVLFLPTAIAKDARILFKGSPLYQQLHLEEPGIERIELRVADCISTINNRFKITAHFAEEFSTKHKGTLDEYIDKHAEKCVSVSQSSPTILITGDDPSQWKAYRFYFEKTQYRLEFATNGKEIFQKLQNLHVDMLLLDTDNAKDKGLPILDELHKRKLRMPTIVITSDKNPETIQKIAPRVQDFLVKPINGRGLVKRLTKVFDRWKGEMRLEQEIGENVGVNVQTRILVVFKDTAVVRRVRKDGLLLYKEQPIIPTTSIYFKAGTLFETMGLEDRNVSHLELLVASCEISSKGHKYRVIAKFKDVPNNIQKMIEAFVDGKPVPPATQPPPAPSEETAEEDDPFALDSGSEFFEDPDGVPITAETTPSESQDKSPEEIRTDNFTIAELEQQLPQSQVEEVLAEQTEDAYFTSKSVEYARKIKALQSAMRDFKEPLQQLANRRMPKVDDQFTKRKFDYTTGRREQTITYRVHSPSTEAFFQLGAVLTNIPKGMGISASLVEDQYNYDPYFVFGLPGDPRPELGAPIEKRTIAGKNIQIYQFTQEKVISLVQTIVNLMAQ